MPQDTVRGKRPLVIHPNDTETLAFIFEDAMPEAATISSIGTITFSPSGQLALGGQIVNAAAFQDLPNGLGQEVPIGKAVLAVPSGQQAGAEYLVTIPVTLSTGGVKVGVFDVWCRSS